MASLDESSSPLNLGSIKEALDNLESGRAVDENLLLRVAKQCKGDHECEITFEKEEGDNLERLYKSCTKNPGHENFIPILDFKIEHLPRIYRKEKVMRSIQYWSNLTVKILVRFVSGNRPLTYPDSTIPYPYSHLRNRKRHRRFGTGNIFGLAGEEDTIKEEVCPCHLCEKLELKDREKVFWTFLVETSKHVIFDASEARYSTFECFYDSDSNKAETVKVLYGYGMNENYSKIEEDLCQVTCVTHDRELSEKLKTLVGDCSLSLLPQYKKGLGILISHPHGCSKRITIGRILHMTVPVGWDYPAGIAIQCDDSMACLLPLLPWSRMPESLDSTYDSLQPYLRHLPAHEKLFSNLSEDSNPLDEDPRTFFPEPGTQFLLPLGTTFTLPKDATYAYRFPRQDQAYFYFPPGTKFTLRNGQEVYLPPEAEFFSYMFSARVCYISYSVDSCEGSSGAALLQDGGGRTICCTFPHSGKDCLTMNANRSGLQSYSILPESAAAEATDKPADSQGSLSSTHIMPHYVRFQMPRQQ